jgi:xyloglucan-specific exo-beta-1,4-glucanase
MVHGDVHVDVLTFGKSPPGRHYPALFAIGERGDLRAIWRSDDVGAAWVRVNDPEREYGRRFRSIAGDPRVFGRVYVGTGGRGIVYGEPSSADKPLNPVDK